MKKRLVKLYRIARLLTSKELTLIFAVAFLALLFTGVSTFGHYEQKKHEEPIIYEEYHSGMALDAPVQFCAVSAKAALYTEKQNGNTTTYYAYIIMKDAKGNRLVTVMQKASSASTQNNDPQASLKLDVSSFVDEINGKGGTLYYGVISGNSLDQQTQSISLMPVNVNEYDKTRMELQSLQTIDIYTDSVPQSTTVVDKSEFVRDGGSWFLLAAAVLLALYIVMCAARRTLEKQGAAELADKEDAAFWNGEINRQAQLRAQEDKQRKAAEKPAQKAEQPKHATVPTPTAVNADAWRAEVYRQAEQRAQEDKQRKEKEQAAEKAAQPKPAPVSASAPAAKATTQKERKTEMDLSSLHLSETGKQIIERTNTPENLLNLVSQAQVSFEMDFKNSRFHSNHFYTVGCIYYTKHYLRIYVAYRESIGGYGYAWNARILDRRDYNSSEELKAAVIEFIAQNGGACTIDQTYIRNCINAAISPDTAQELWKVEKPSAEENIKELLRELNKGLKEMIAESKIMEKATQKRSSYGILNGITWTHLGLAPIPLTIIAGLAEILAAYPYGVLRRATMRYTQSVNVERRSTEQGVKPEQRRYMRQFIRPWRKEAK